MASCFDGREGSREGSATSPTRAVLPAGSGIVRALPSSLRHPRLWGVCDSLSSRERFAPCRGSRGKSRGIQTQAKIEAKPPVPGFRIGPCSGAVATSIDFVDAITRSSGIAERPHWSRHSAGWPPHAPEDSILYCHGRFLGPIVYNGMRRPDTVTLSRRGYDMSTEQAPPFLVDAVRASASKMQGMRAALDARAKELDALKGQLDSERQDLEKRAGRLEAERRAIDGESEEGRAARASVDQDLAAIRAHRENFSAEQARFQDAANGLGAPEKALREAERKREHLDHEMIGRMREADAKFLAIVNREEGLVKLQQDWLAAFETREQELRTITEQMHAQQEESAELHGSLALPGSCFKSESDRLAAQRQELAAKEESLLEVQRYLATVIEAADVGPGEAERPRSPPADEPPAPTESPPPPMPIVTPPVPEPVQAENTPEPDERPPVTRAEGA